MTDTTLNNVTSGFNLSLINDNFETIEVLVNNEMLHLVGGNNIMRQNLDMNSNRIYNLPNALDPTEPVTLGQLVGTISTGFSVAEECQIATAAQTLFTLSDITYDSTSTDNPMLVFVNGAKLCPEDWDGTSNDSVTINSPVMAGGEVVNFVVVQSGDTVGTGPKVNRIERQFGSDIVQFESTYTSTLTQIDYVVGNNSLSVYVQGVLQDLGKDYIEVSTTSIQWVGATPKLNDAIKFISGQISGDVANGTTTLASEVTYIPDGCLVATNVQDAIDELCALLNGTIPIDYPAFFDEAVYWLRPEGIAGNVGNAFTSWANSGTTGAVGTANNVTGSLDITEDATTGQKMVRSTSNANSLTTTLAQTEILGDHSMWVVMKQDTPSGVNDAFLSHGHSTIDWMGISNATSPTIAGSVYDDYTVAGEPMLLGKNVSTSSQDFNYINNMPPRKGTDAVTGIQGYTLFSLNDLSANCVGSIGEVIMFSRTLTELETRELQDYMVSNWRPADLVPPSIIADAVVYLNPETIAQSAGNPLVNWANAGTLGAAADGSDITGTILVGTDEYSGLKTVKTTDQAAQNSIEPATALSALSDPSTVIILGRNSDPSGGHYWIQDDTTAGTAAILQDGSSDIEIVDASGTGLLESGFLPNDGLVVVAATWNGSDTEGRLNYKYNLNANTINTSGSWSPYMLFNAVGPTGASVQTLGEVLIFDKLLTDSEIHDIFVYLTTKWNYSGDYS